MFTSFALSKTLWPIFFSNRDWFTNLMQNIVFASQCQKKVPPNLKSLEALLTINESD